VYCLGQRVKTYLLTAVQSLSLSFWV